MGHVAFYWKIVSKKITIGKYKETISIYSTETNKHIMFLFIYFLLKRQKLLLSCHAYDN